MSKEIMVVLDVGGTTVDGACITPTGEIIGEVVEHDSPSAVDTAEEVVERIAKTLEAASEQAADYDIVGCGIAMPGPFDYDTGNSMMSHKFVAIHAGRGVEFGAMLRGRTGLLTWFINDADAFALGAHWRQFPQSQRFVGITIGTGLGSGFIEDGMVVAEDDKRIPPKGEIWDLPYKEGHFEDYVSAGAARARYQELRAGESLDAEAVAALAIQGNEHAVQAYHRVGQELGTGLAPIFRRFPPEHMVIGGKVARSLDLFKPALEAALVEAGLQVPYIVPATSGNLALWGAARHALNRAQSTA